jgi:ribosomal protein L3 glutamine methyltransferase
MVTTGPGPNNAPATPATRGDALAELHAALEAAELHYGHGTDNAWDEAVQLLLGVLRLPPDSDDSVLRVPLATSEWAQLWALLRQRIDERVPLPYLLGEAWFAGLRFLCDRRALVPRSPLAELIVADYAPWWRGRARRRILDLCCGGGSIGIAARVYAPQAALTLSDIDAGALALARDNLALHGLEGQVRVVQADLFEGLAGEQFDLVLCNPPYVDREDIAALPAEFGAEPPRGLGAGDDGLDLALKILARAPQHLAAGAYLFLELGNSWEALDALCPRLPLTWVEFARGGHGVLAASAGELRDWQPHFAALARSREPVS